MLRILSLLLVACACGSTPQDTRTDPATGPDSDEPAEPTEPAEPAPEPSACPPPRTSGGACAAVMVWVKHPETSACCEYGSPCAAPEGWMQFHAEDECASAGNTWQGLQAPEPNWLACGQDSDCAVVEIACCDHCNGGRAIPVNTQSVTLARERYRPTCSPTTVCTQLACADPESACVNGSCQIRVPR
ncbi:MAG: hypothetical protein AAGE52_06250 [Myxococcota bacterium]